jgi:hypothetical protein
LFESVNRVNQPLLGAVEAAIRPLSVHAGRETRIAMNRRTISAAYYYSDEVGTG